MIGRPFICDVIGKVPNDIFGFGLGARGKLVDFVFDFGWGVWGGGDKAIL